VGFIREYGRRLGASKEFAAARGWTLTSWMRSDAEQRSLLDQMPGEPFHPPERDPGAFPYPVLGGHRHQLSGVMLG
jgi:hypothetical protein